MKMLVRKYLSQAFERFIRVRAESQDSADALRCAPATF